jgi:general stress protein CsbA
MMKPIETIWFENISVFSEPILSIGPIRASMKQLLYTLLALGLAFSMLNFLKNPVLAIPIAGLLLLFAYAKPYGQNFEVLLIDMVSFFKRKKEIGVVAEDKKKEEKKDKDKDKKGKEKDIPKVTVTDTYTNTDTSTDSNTASNTTIPTTDDSTNTNDIESVTVKDPRESFTVIKSNLLHYIVPKHKDFDLEVTDNELVVVTGSSTIHIPSSSSKVKLLIEIDNREIVRIVVNEQS